MLSELLKRAKEYKRVPHTGHDQLSRSVPLCAEGSISCEHEAACHTKSEKCYQKRNDWRVFQICRVPDRRRRSSQSKSDFIRKPGTKHVCVLLSATFYDTERVYLQTLDQSVFWATASCIHITVVATRI